MMRDITIGQHFPADSLLHKLDPRIKLIGVLLYVVMIFVCSSVYSYVFVTLCTLITVFMSKVPLKMYLKGLKPLSFIIIFTAILNLLLTKGDTAYILGYPLKYGIINITYQGIAISVSMALRIIFLVIGTSVLTFTTSPIMLTDGIERLLSPFRKIGVPSHELAMMMTIAMRFIPTLVEETDKIIKAQSARGAEFDTGGIFKKIKAIIPILVPLFISSFRRADELATAMECRCYRGGEGRTRLRELKCEVKDFVALAIIFIFALAIIVINIFL